MKTALAYALVMVPAFISALPFAQVSSASGAGAKVSHTVIAASGTAAPAGGIYNGFSLVRRNARGQTAFRATLRGPSTTGVFLEDRTGTAAIALGGNPDPSAANFGFVGDPSLTRRGEVLFDADGSSTFISNGRILVPLVRNGDPAPGVGTLTPFSFVANARGVIAYDAAIAGSPSTFGTFLTDGATTVSIARDNTLAPGGGSFTFFDMPAINDGGQVAFVAEMADGPADFGIFRGDGRSLTAVFLSNQAAPGGATFQDFGDPAINNRGQVAASALLSGPDPNGLFVGDGDHTVAIALEGQPAPKGGTYRGIFADPITLNDRGDVAFSIGLTGSAGGHGIFRGDGTHTTAIALAGTLAPGTTGTFNSFGDMKLGEDGRVAFIATLTPGVGGVDTTNSKGIWVGTSDGDLQLVVRTGDVVGGNVLTNLPSGPGQLDMSGRELAWIGTFPSRATAVVLSRVDADRDESHDR
jgi:hypothetical protein